MGYYDSEEIYDLEKEVLALKQELHKLRVEKSSEIRQLEHTQKALLDTAYKRIGELQFKLDIARVVLKTLIDGGDGIDYVNPDLLQKAKVALAKLDCDQ